jgi:hypothetical protein
MEKEFTTFIKNNKNKTPLCLQKLEVIAIKKTIVKGKMISVKAYRTELYSKRLFFKNITRFL